jgi:hypothetical protein
VRYLGDIWAGRHRPGLTFAPTAPSTSSPLGPRPRGLKAYTYDHEYYFFFAFALPVPQDFPFALFLAMHAIALPSFHTRMVFGGNHRRPLHLFVAASVLFGAGVIVAGSAATGALAARNSNSSRPHCHNRCQYSPFASVCQHSFAPAGWVGHSWESPPAPRLTHTFPQDHLGGLPIQRNDWWSVQVAETMASGSWPENQRWVYAIGTPLPLRLASAG